MAPLRPNEKKKIGLAYCILAGIFNVDSFFFFTTYRGFPGSTNSDLNLKRHRNVLEGLHLSSILRPMQNHKILARTQTEVKTKLLNLNQIQNSTESILLVDNSTKFESHQSILTVSPEVQALNTMLIWPGTCCIRTRPN